MLFWSRFTPSFLFVLLSLAIPYSVQAQTYEGTPTTDLVLAAKNSSKETMESLLQKGADPNSTDKFGHTPLYFAVKNNSREETELLLGHGADPNIEIKGKGTPVYVAASNNNAELIHLLLSHGADPNKGRQIFPPLHNAIHSGRNEAALALIEGGADVKRVGVAGQTAINLAAWKGMNNVLQALLDRGAVPDVMTLHSAAAGGNPETLGLLLDAGMDINARMRFKGTPLHAAARRGQLENCRYLVEHGVDINAVTEMREKTALDEAVEQKHADVAAYLRPLTGS